MIEEALHLKTKLSFQENSGVDESQMIINKFIESFINLDVSIFEPVMSEMDVFENKDKYRFLQLIHSIFESCRTKTFGNFFVSNETTICSGCSKGKRVEYFKIFKKDRQELQAQIAFLIDIVDGKLVDIYRCNYANGINLLWGSDTKWEKNSDE